MDRVDISRRGDFWVAFTDQTDLAFLKILKRGFRHCFVLVHDGMRWISFDPLAGHTELMSYPELGAEFDFPAHLRRTGHTMVKVKNVQQDHKPSRMAPVMIHTCVEAVKRLIGVRGFFILTPWQLYRHLIQFQTNTQMKEITTWEA